MVLRVKITVLGEPSVGKTSLVSKYCKNQFPTEHRATLGADFTTKKVKLQGTNVEIVLWDIAGTTSFEIERMSDYYLQGSNGFFLVYDLTSKESLNKLTEWYKKAERICGDIPFIILGNKNDLYDFIKEDKESMSDKERIKTLGLHAEILDTSAKTGVNVEFAIISLLELILRGRNRA